MSAVEELARDEAALVVGARWVTLSTVTVGAVNYVYSLALTTLLDHADFAVFAAAQSLLLIVGTVASVAVPWVLAGELVRAENRLQREDAVSFAVLVNIVQGVLAALVVGAVSLGFASADTALVAGLSAGVIVIGTTGYGWLQGVQRFGVLAGLKLGEALTKVVAGVALILLGTGVTGAVGAFGVGGLVTVVASLVLVRRSFRPRATALRLVQRWRTTAGVVGVQGLVALLTGQDLILAALMPIPSADAATYQVAMILARIPVFLGSAIAVVVFPLLSRPGATIDGVLRLALRTYALLAIPVAVGLMTVPVDVLGAIFPEEYGGLTFMLPITAMAGLSFGLVNLSTTVFQAKAWFAASIRRQAVGAAIHLALVLTGALTYGVAGLAVGSAVGASVAAALLLGVLPSSLRGRLRPSTGGVLKALTLGVVLALASRWAWLWLLAAALIGGIAAWSAVGPVRRQQRARHDGPNRDRLQILHLGFEDHRRPGSGGGALRTHEIDRRLAERHDVTVLAAGWPGAQDRVEDGVRYEHIGWGRGYLVSLLTYFVALPFAVRGRRADLIVEEFAAPMSTALSPLWSGGTPVIGMVQWLNAREKSREYHVPFHLIERFGVPRYPHLITVSEAVADRLRTANPAAEVQVIGNGVDPRAFEVPAQAGRDIVFLGRLEREQKGLDMLLDAWSSAAERIDGDLVVAGDGVDEAWARRRVTDLDLEDRVRFVGRVEGDAKLALLAGARVTAMPSRFETFGIVAAESLACATPVIAFELPCLREVVTAGTGVLVPAFDVAAFADALVTVARDPLIEEMGRRGRREARRHDWDVLADRQEQRYLEVLEVAASRP